MNERLLHLNHAGVAGNLQRIEPSGNVQRDIADLLKGTVFGQDKAMDELSRILARASAGIHDPNKPMGSVVLLGPTGVGKTETARAIGNVLLGDKEEAKKRTLFIDCGDFTQEHDVKKIQGAPHSYVGYGDDTMISAQWLASYQPGVIVVDEIEKAHPSFYKVLLSMLGDGRITVNTPYMSDQGMKRGPIEFSLENVFFVITSNLGAQEIQRLVEGRTIGFGPQHKETDLHSAIEKSSRAELEKHFRNNPEFLGRIDAIVTYEPISDPEVYTRIVDKFTGQFNENNGEQFALVSTLYDSGKKDKQDKPIMRTRKENQKVRDRIAPYMALTQEAKELLIERGTKDKRYGARDIKRSFELLTTEIAELMADDIVGGEDAIVVSAQNGLFEFYKV